LSDIFMGPRRLPCDHHVASQVVRPLPNERGTWNMLQSRAVGGPGRVQAAIRQVQPIAKAHRRIHLQHAGLPIEQQRAAPEALERTELVAAQFQPKPRGARNS